MNESLSNDPQTATSPRPRRSLTERLKEWDTWWSMLLLLFCVTAVCGLPFLWMSKAYRPTGKVALTVLVILYTLLIFWIFWVVMAWSFARIWEAIG